MRFLKILAFSVSWLALASAPTFAGQLCTETGGVSIAETKAVDDSSVDANTPSPTTQPVSSNAGVLENQHQGHMHGGGNNNPIGSSDGT